MMPRQGAIALIVINLARGAGAIPPSIAGSIEPSSQPTPARTYGHQCGLVRREGQLVLTPLALALIMIELRSDLCPGFYPGDCSHHVRFVLGIHEQYWGVAQSLSSTPFSLWPSRLAVRAGVAWRIALRLTLGLPIT
jgi:radical SAM superfamily enzyme YgiQ (UPF0313 family)